MVSISEKLTNLRLLMREEQLDCYFIPSRDEHNNEYVPDCWQRRQWFSGFSGSAGDLLISQNEALLWTDSRYFLQAEQQLDANHFKLMKIDGRTPTILDWLNQKTHLRVGVNPRVISLKQVTDWQKRLALQKSELIAIENDLVDQIWLNRPQVPKAMVNIQLLKLAGESHISKIEKVRKRLSELKAEAHVVVNLDAIAWVLNIRGNDIAYNPVVISYLIITLEKVFYFVDSEKIDDKALSHLERIHILPHDQFRENLHDLRGKVLLDPGNVSWWVQQQILSNSNSNQAAFKEKIVLGESPITRMKAIKNQEEQQGMVKAHEEDAIALIKFFTWLEKNWQNGLDEIEAASQLEYFRQQSEISRGLSFATISAFGEHSAIIHYQPKPETSIKIDDSNLYLLDSGGQYQNGTTDVTRTLHLGSPTALQKKYYTLVLKGHLALRHAVFPEGTCGSHLDALARQFLWEKGLNYGHGTGHGVGCYLCVHEGPQNISTGFSSVSLQPGMMISNEPGVYFNQQYGVRIENVCQVVSHFLNFYTFKDLTLVPYALNLVELSLLREQEIEWINEYHQLIDARLSSRLGIEEKRWLKNATRAL